MTRPGGGSWQQGRGGGGRYGSEQGNAPNPTNRIAPSSARQPGPAAAAGRVISDADAKEIIAEGNAELLVKKAQELAAEADGQSVTRTSVRRLFGETRRIEVLWQQGDILGKTNPEEADSARRAAARRGTLLVPRMRYQSTRAKGAGLGVVEANLNPLLAEVGQDKEKFQRFAEFFEALVAYLREDKRRD